jgi:signal transduction histidine kinase
VGILLALIAAGVAVDILASRNLHHTLDQTLRQRAVEVSQLSALAPALITTPGSLDSPLAGSALLVEVLDRRGRIVARSLALGGRVLPAATIVAAAIRDGRTSFSTAPSGGEAFRLYAAPLADFGGAGAGGAVVVAGSEREMNHTLASLHLFFLLAGLVAVLIAGPAVAVLLRRALRPVAKLADAAAEVERTGDPRQRLPDSGATDEVGRLAVVLNAMLASLERSRNAQGRFLADASHELRTPLTALRGNVAYLQRHGSTPEVLADLSQDAERLAQLADDFLALSREEASMFPEADVRLDRLAQDLAARDEAVDLVVSDPITVRAEASSLERAIENLIQNAHVHGPPGGRIRLTVTDMDGLAVLSVEDEGPGVPTDEADLVFERFWRSDPSRVGSGLGLAIVRATAERHGGRAYVAGSRFTIELPTLTDFSRSPARTSA